MNLTDHAQLRSRQRAIPHAVVSAIYDFGSARTSRGLTALTLDRIALNLAKDELPRSQLSKLERYSGCYLVVGDEDQIVTVARRKRRFRQ